MGINKERLEYEEQLSTVDYDNVIDAVGAIREDGLEQIDTYELGLFLSEDLGFNPFDIKHINN